MTKAVVTWGRLNPLTIGHQKLVDKVKAEAKKRGATPHVYLSHSQDAKKNPLDYNTKIRYARKAFGPSVTKSTARTIIEVMKELETMKHSEVVLVVGSDRVQEFKTLLNKYNGKEFTFDKIDVVSAGDRDPDSDDVSGMSASKMRAAAQAGEQSAFEGGLPGTLSKRDKTIIYNRIRKVMGVSESIEIDDEEFEFTDQELNAFIQMTDLESLDEDIDINEEFEEVFDQLDERGPLNISQRMAIGRRMKRLAPRMKRQREIRKKRMADKPRLEKRSRKAAIKLLRKRFAGKQGQNYASLSPGAKMSVDRIIQKKMAMVGKISKRLLPKIRKAEMERLKKARSGPQKESIDARFESMISESTQAPIQRIWEEEEDEGTNSKLVTMLRQAFRDPVERMLVIRALKGGSKSLQNPKLRPFILKLLNRLLDATQDDPSMFAKMRDKLRRMSQADEKETNESFKAFTSLKKKSDMTGIPLDVILEVFEREDNPDLGFNRVNSFINGGKAWELDSDLAEKVKEPTGKLKDACWAGYTAVGTKKKNGKTVPNCVPKEEVETNEAKSPLQRLKDFDKTRAAVGKKPIFKDNEKKKEVKEITLAKLKGKVERGVMSRSKRNELIQKVKEKGLVSVAKMYGMTPRQLQAITESFELDEKVNQSQIDQLEKFADRILAKYDIDVEFTRHFVDRLNDPRNNPEIKVVELQKFFKKIQKNKGKDIKSNPDTQVVLKDLTTNLNLPVVINYKDGEFEVVNKTIMRKKDFKTPDKTIQYENAVAAAREKIKREKEADKVKHDAMLDRARLQKAQNKNRATESVDEAFESYLEEGINDPAIFKAVFLAGGPGSGKSFVVKKTGLASMGFVVINSDDAFERALKKAGLSTTPEDIFSVKGQEIRGGAKTLTAKRQETVLKGRLGVVVDGTGRDYDKIQKQAQILKDIGYDVGMIFVNTSMETALERNRQRERTLPDDTVEKMWKDVQKNMGKFQRFFGQNFQIVDNSIDSDFKKEIQSAFKMMSKFAKKPIINLKAKKWIEQEKKKRGINESFEIFLEDEHENCGTPDCCGQCPTANTVSESLTEGFTAGISDTMFATEFAQNQVQGSFAYHPSVMEEGGAGELGTDKLKKKYKEDTPCEEVEEVEIYDGLTDRLRYSTSKKRRAKNDEIRARMKSDETKDRIAAQKASMKKKAAERKAAREKAAREIEEVEIYDGDDFFEAYGVMWYNEDEELDEAEYQGRKVTLGKPTSGDVKKFKVYVKSPSTGNIKKVEFGDPNMTIKKHIPARRKSFRARHNCDNPGPRDKARYWSCKKW